MLRRFIYAGLLLALVATPAVATHVNEPTAPITGLHLRILHYASTPRVIADCDWGVYPFIAARIEARVSFTAKPSEHFHALVEVFKLRGPNPEEKKQAGLIPMWAAGWAHQNVPPHGITPPFDPVEGSPQMYKFTDDHTNTWFRDSSQTTNQSVAEPGFYRIEATVTGEESGNTFTEVCVVEVPADAEF